LETGCYQRSWPAKAGADELEADRQKASPIRNVAKHLATRPGHRSPAHGTTRSVPARGRSDRSEQQPPDRGPLEARPRCCTRCASVTLYEIRRLARRCPSRESLLLVQFSIALKEEIIAL